MLLFRLYLCLVGVLSAANGQSTFSVIVGTVSDSSGAAVPNAEITATALDSGRFLRISTNDQGRFDFPNVRTGRYRIAAVKAGFADAGGATVEVRARETVRVDLTLEVAARADTARVTASVPLVGMETSTVADTKTLAQIDRLPANYRGATVGPLPAIIVVPGVQEDDSGRISIGGAMPSQTEFTVDGVSTLNAAGGGALGVLYRSSDVVSAEAVSEFRVSSIGNQAEFGQVNDVTVVTRSGSNALHGSLLWYHQNAALDAKTYGAPAKQSKVLNTVGGALGGPVMLPRLYDGHNRTFLFVNLEGSRKPSSVFEQFSLPTAAMRSGDLNGVPGPSALDPKIGAPFPGNVIPQERISSFARALFGNYLPVPNYPGSSNNYRRLTRRNTNANLYTARLDQIAGSRAHLFATLSRNNSEYSGNWGILPASRLPTATKAFIGAVTFAIHAGVVNEARFGWTEFRQDEVFPLQGKQADAVLGLEGLNLSNAGSGGGFPYINFSDGTGFASTFKWRDTHTRSATGILADALMVMAGAHRIKMGVDLRRASTEQTLHGGDGADDFGGLEFDSGVFSGSAFADLLLGLPAYSYYAALGPNARLSATHSASFFQDEWKVRRNLTLSLGLRWELHPPFAEANGNLTTIRQSDGAVILPDVTPAPAPGFRVGVNACPGSTSSLPCTQVLAARQAGLPSVLRETYYRDWNPRLGFAWQPFHSARTVIRGSAGIYTQLLLGSIASAMTGVHSSDVRTFENTNSGGTPLFQLPLVSPGGLGQLTAGGEDFFDATNPNLKDPRVIQWSFTIERELPGNNVVRSTYVASHASGMPVRVNLNQPRASVVPQPKPYAAWGNVVSLENLGFTSYEALQLEGGHRFQRGFFYQASYVLSKNLGNLGEPPGNRAVFPLDFYSTLITDRYNPRYDRGNLAGARRQRFLLTGLFPLPFGAGARTGNRWRSVANLIGGGWELSTITLLETGPYLTPTMSPALDRSNTNAGALRGGQARPDRISDGNTQALDRIWDLNSFTAPPRGAGRFGNAGAGVLRGPGTIAVAAGLSKTLVVRERAQVRLEATFTNVPNHPNFLPPANSISNPQFGRLTTVQSAENSGNRTGQLGMRVEF